MRAIRRLRIPILPVSAFLFYILMLSLWKSGLIPSPSEVLLFLEDLYNKYGYFGVAIATFVESIVYLGLYFPGSLIIALAVFLSDGSFISLFTISVIVALTLTLTAVINYMLGRYVIKNKTIKDENFVKTSAKFSKGLFFSMLHPNLIAFYFFNAGLEKHNFKKLFYVPLFMVPYGYAFGYILSRISEIARKGLENPGFVTALIFVWLTAALVFENRRRKRS